MTHTVHLQFEEIDNTVLQRLCGALDSNLEALGKALNIQISRRFEHFTFPLISPFFPEVLST